MLCHFNLLKKYFYQILRIQTDLSLEYYTIKTKQIQIEITEQKRKKEEATRSGDVGFMDMKVLHTELSENRKSYTTLQTEYIDLTNRLQELEESLETIRFGHNPKLIALDRELAMLQGQYNEYQAATSGIHENNVSLQFEIKTYRRLLEGNKEIFSDFDSNIYCTLFKKTFLQT
jgi:chromosome segregation ATPase